MIATLGRLGSSDLGMGLREMRGGILWLMIFNEARRFLLFFHRFFKAEREPTATDLSFLHRRAAVAKRRNARDSTSFGATLLT